MVVTKQKGLYGLFKHSILNLIKSPFVSSLLTLTPNKALTMTAILNSAPRIKQRFKP